MQPLSPRDTKVPPPPSSPHHDDIMFRRREKRRHVTHNAIDLRDPYSVIALAIRFDESIAVVEDDDGALLKVPLETGSIYNQKAFAKALSNLQKQTTAPRPTPRKLPLGVAADSASAPQAITPVILSGLVAAIQNRSEDDKGPSAVELVAYCRSMRRAALTRLRQHIRRRRIQRNVTPVILLIIVLGLLFWTLSNVTKVMTEYDFVGDGGDGSCQSSKACRLAATQVWIYCDPSRRLVIPGCTLDHCDVGEGQLDYPFYTIHTVLRSLYMPLSEINNPRMSSSKILWPHRRQSSSARQQSPVQWLGESIVNRLIRETVHDYISSSTSISMLDVGCGVGGTLYAMLDGENPPLQPFRYHGIAISTPEIYQAKQFLSWHGLDSPAAKERTNSEILFEKRDFDTPFPLQSFSVIVAVESLSYSPDVLHTLHLLVKSLQKDGLLLIVDDMVAPWVSEERAEELRSALGKPSLKTYQQWVDMIQTMPHMVQKELWDLSLEFDMSYMLRDSRPEAGMLGTVMDWRYRIAQGLADKLTSWFGQEEERKNTSLRLIQLTKNLFENELVARARRQAYRNADIIYYFMIVAKT